MALGFGVFGLRVYKARVPCNLAKGPPCLAWLGGARRNVALQKGYPESPIPLTKEYTLNYRALIL